MENEKTKLNLTEELANSVTHGVGLLLSIAGTVILVVSASLHGDAWRVVSFSIYGSSFIVLYASSTLYHGFLYYSFLSGRIKYILTIIDYSAIYLFIAGSYTPFALVSFRGPLGWTFFGTTWCLALAGIVFKMFFAGRFPVLSTISYLIMGWLALLAIPPILRTLPPGAIAWLLAGGVLYSLGVLFYLRDKTHYHAIWHLFVLGGSLCHYFAIFFYVLPMPG